MEFQIQPRSLGAGGTDACGGVGAGLSRYILIRNFTKFQPDVEGRTWVQLLREEPPEFANLSLSARGLGALLLKKCDREGKIHVPLGKSAAEAVIFLFGATRADRARLPHDLKALGMVRYLVFVGFDGAEAESTWSPDYSGDVQNASQESAKHPLSTAVLNQKVRSTCEAHAKHTLSTCEAPAEHRHGSARNPAESLNSGSTDKSREEESRSEGGSQVEIPLSPKKAEERRLHFLASDAFGTVVKAGGGEWGGAQSAWSQFIEAGRVAEAYCQRHGLNPSAWLQEQARSFMERPKWVLPWFVDHVRAAAARAPGKAARPGFSPPAPPEAFEGGNSDWSRESFRKKKGA